MTATATATGALPISDVEVSCFTVPTSTPEEADGTHVWDATTVVVVEVVAGGVAGMGYTYGHPAVATVVQTLADLLRGADAFHVRRRNRDMRQALRNAGAPGIGAHAISAVDVALWDLKARALDLPLCDLLGTLHDGLPVYGSGGFCNHTSAQVAEQLTDWVDSGFDAVKMKVGCEPDRDTERVAAVREALGDGAELMVDANGAYTVEQALACSASFAEHGVTWHEEPVSSDDPAGLRRIRQSAPAGMAVAAGEYAYDPFHVRDLIHAEAIDCAQADVSRCGGVTGFLDVALLCEAEQIDLSAHCVPALSVQVGVASPRLRHLEYFHDHVRIEERFFDGAPTPTDGVLRPDRSRPGHGLTLRRNDIQAHRT